MIMMHPHQHQHQHQQHSTPPQSHHINPPPSCSSISLRSPSANSAPPNAQPHARPDQLPFGSPGQAQESAGPLLARVRLSDLLPYDGAPAASYFRAVESLSGSLMRHNAAVIEVGCDDATVLRCGLEAARLYFRTQASTGAGAAWGKGSRGVYMYKPGR